MKLIPKIIRKSGSQYTLHSHTGKHLGTFASRGLAEKREQQINYFKAKGPKKTNTPRNPKPTGQSLKKRSTKSGY